MRLKSRNKKKIILIAAAVTAFLCAVLLVVFITTDRVATPQASHETTKKPTTQKTSPPSFDKSKYSTVDPSSIWIVVNKPHPLVPDSFVPNDLVSVGSQRVSTKAATDLQKLISDAATQNIKLRVISGFRSYSYQSSLYNSYVASDGRAAADTYSARPGHSEHQTGLAVDIGGAHGCDVEQCFGSTPEGIWLREHVGQYGFIIRYTESNQSVTGYQAEPWHLRYIGIELANEMKKQNISTLEEFFNITGGTSYSN